MIPLTMTSVTFYPDFKVMTFLDIGFLRNDTR